MKAAIYTEYGPPEVLRIEEVEKPVPGNKDVLIRIHAAAATTGDSNMRGFTFVPPGFGPLPRLMFGLRRPRKQIIGLNIAGDVEAVGKNVTRFKPGDRVFGSTGNVLGGYAEYVSIPEQSPIVIKPDTISYEAASTLTFGAQTALHFIRDLGKITAGQNILVNGASGSVGSYAVQLAKYYGAHVTAVCSEKNHQLVRDLGADEVIDYTKEDFTKNEKQYDAIFDVIGKIPYSALKGSLTEKGVFLAVEGGLSAAAHMALTSMTGGRKVKMGVGLANTKDLEFFKELIAQKKLKTAIDAVYPFDQIVAAHRHVDSGHKKGDVVISIHRRTEGT